VKDFTFGHSEKMLAILIDPEKSQDYLHPVRNALLLLLASIAFVLYGAFGRRFREFGFRLPDKLWATLPSRIVYFVLGLCFLLGAFDQLRHVH
jgi:drug/metabolite transporter (DMT)-like permease